MKPAKDKNHLLLENLPDGFARHQILIDSNGNPVDYLFLDVNPAFEKMTGLTRDRVIGKKVTEVLPEIENSHFDWIGTYGKVALTGESIRFEQYSESFDRWYEVTAYSDEPGFFAVVFHNITENKRVEEALRESEVRFREIVEHTQAGYFYMDLEGKFQHVNNAWLRMHSYDSPDEIIGKHFAVTQVEADQKKAQHNVEKLLSGETIPSGEFSRRCKDGSVGYHTFSAKPILKGNQVVGLEGFLIDTTEKKHEAQETKDAHQRLLTVLNSIEAFIYVVDMDTYELLFINEYAAKISGDISGKKCWQAIQVGQTGPCDFCTNDKLLDAVGQPTGVYQWEFKNTKSGRWYECRDTALQWTDGRIVRLEMATDITDRKQMEEKLQESENQFRAIFELASVGISQVDPSNGKLVSYNNKYCELTGYIEDELNNLSFLDLTHPEDRMRDWEIFTRAARGETPYYQNEKRYIHKDGSVVWVRVNAAFICDDAGQPIRTVAVCEDITERKQAEEALRESEAQVRLKLASILSPEGDIGNLNLSDIIDVEAVQSLMNDFYKLTNIGMAIVDINGNALVGTGWQDVCVNFHRAHPDTARYCMESKIELDKNLEPGLFKLCKCKNNMWDTVTPIVIGGSHLGNLYMGQFFFDDEEINYDLFRVQARKYGFNENDYISALEKVPRWNRDTVNTVMKFYNKFANTLSLLSYSNIRLAHLLSERDFTIVERKKVEQKLADYTQELEQLYHKLDEEVDKARKVHDRTLPKSLPKVEGLSFAAHYQPAQRLGGDFYDVIRKDNKLIFYLSDVSGHGLDGAMLSVFVKHTIKGYLAFSPPGSISPANILQYINEQFSQESYPEEYFICIFLAVLDLDSMKLTYSGAGFQNTPLVRMGNGEKIKLISRGLFITSYLPKKIMKFQEESILLTPGTIIFLNTDGLTEQENEGAYYMDRLPSVFYANAHLTPHLVAQAVSEDFCRFNNGSLQGKDDITFLVLQVDTVDKEIGQQNQ
jgi:PAS domain S-box-containing protein